MSLTIRKLNTRCRAPRGSDRPGALVEDVTRGLLATELGAQLGPSLERLPAVLANTSGFVYYVSITGITGAAAPDLAKTAAAVARIKRHCKLPVAVGFGVRTAEQAAALASSADGVVVGSALVNTIKASLDENNRATAGTVKAVIGLVSELARGVRQAARSKAS